jgi:predicted permease
MIDQPALDRRRRRYRRLAALLPGEFRAAVGRDLEEAALVCLAREHARRGSSGVALAWLALARDVVSTSASLRIARRQSTERRRGFMEAVMDAIARNIRHSGRMLRRQPGFTAIAVLTLALGIGANTAIFSVVDAVLLRPLQYPEPDQLEFVTTRIPSMNLDRFWMSPPEVFELAAHSRSFSAVGAYSAQQMNLGDEPPRRVNVAVVTDGLMPTLGVRPQVGRWFGPDDTHSGSARVAILSWELWQSAFGGRDDVLGATIVADGITRTVVGVMPQGYDVHDEKIALWVPLRIDPADLPSNRGSHFLHAVARRKSGVTPAQARADLDEMQTHWADFVPYNTPHLFQTDGAVPHTLRIDPLKSDVVGGARTGLVVLQGAVVLVLVIACANLANLLLARSETRQREFAVRTAMGAERRQLFAQFLIEGLVLSMAGAAGGAALAWLLVHGVIAANADAIPRATEVAFNWRVLGFTMLLTAGTGLVFALAPLAGVGRRLTIALRDGSRTTGTRAQRTVRGVLVVAEVTLAVMLLAGAGLLVRSLSNLLSVDAGFNPSRLATFQVVVSPVAYAEAQRRADFFTQLTERASAIGGVERVAAMDGLPPHRPILANDTDFEHIPDTPQAADSTLPQQNVDYWQMVTLGYTETMGIPIVRGRGFEPADAGGAPVVLVNEALVKRFYEDVDGRDPIGTRLKAGFGSRLDWYTVVGVVKDVKQGGVDAPVGTELYFLVEQSPRVAGFASPPTGMHVVLRTGLPLSALRVPITDAVRGLDPSLPVVSLRTMDDVFVDSVSRPRFLTQLLAGFAVLALCLAAIGTYGVLSYMVTQRRQEIGIRMAMGADRRDVLALVMRHGARLAGIGIVIGVVGALAVGRVMTSLLFGVSPTDLPTIAGVASATALVACAACLVPALRATRLDPQTMIRS